MLSRFSPEISEPDNPTAEMQHRFVDFAGAVSDLVGHLQPDARERRVAAVSNLADLSAREDRRFALACDNAHLIVETAAKLTYVMTLGSAPPRRHKILELLEHQPAWVRDAFVDHARGIDFDAFDSWHQGADFRDALPVEHFDDVYLRRHVAAANRIAAFVGDQSRDRGFDADVLRRSMTICRRILTPSTHHCARCPILALTSPRSHDRGVDL